MKALITGICGFVGSVLAEELPHLVEGLQIVGLDNLSRPGSEVNRRSLRTPARLIHGDIRNPSDLEFLPKVDWVIDAAANPSVLAGLSAEVSSRQLMEHNLIGTLNLLEYCKRVQAGMVILSTSRVYSLGELVALPLDVQDSGFRPRLVEGKAPPGLSDKGVSEVFSTQPPLSLYGSAKLASELLAQEYAHSFGLPIHINRCGVLAGAGQFGKPDQGIFSFWIHSYRRRRSLKYIGFGGTGYQLRDCLHPRDLASLIARQLGRDQKGATLVNVSGGANNSMSLAQLSGWCADRFGYHEVKGEASIRQFDVPWLVLDSSRSQAEWGWTVSTPLDEILNEIADHADNRPDWLELSESQ
jgi:CDP-paratose 2-epimerase